MNAFGLNEQQYLALCKICDSILMRHDSTPERVAIGWLHIIREHPVFLSQYKDLFKSEKAFKVFVRRVLLVLRGKLSWYFQVVKAIFSDGRPWFGAEQLCGHIDVLFVSHLINPGQGGQEADFYFGEMPEKLNESGYSVLVSLINHTDQPSSDFKNKWDNCVVPRVILAKTLGLKGEIANHQRLKKEASLITKITNTKVSDLSKHVMKRASVEALASGTHSNLRIASQLNSLVTRYKPKILVITHEGHAWERLAFFAAHHADNGVKCFGYQHAVMFRLQHAIKRNLASEYNPDHILTSGSIGKEVLHSAQQCNNIPVSVIGSNRTSAANPNIPESKSKINKATCLVIPEGILSECNLLFEYSLDCAKAVPHIQFIWRLHPVIDIKSLLDQNPKFKKLPTNIVLSTASLEQDIMNSQWALYRGSTAVISALGYGLRPIYYECDNELPIDPLYDLKSWRMHVKTVKGFMLIVQNDLKNDMNYNTEDYLIAKEHCDKYYMPPDMQLLLEIIENEYSIKK